MQALFVVALYDQNFPNKNQTLSPSQSIFCCVSPVYMNSSLNYVPQNVYKIRQKK